MASLKTIFAKLIGILELFGFRYPVKPYMHQVSVGLWRGSRLENAKAYQTLKDLGITCLVDLTAEGTLDRGFGYEFGFMVANIPVIDNTVPTKEQVFKFIRLTREQKVFVHCQAGKGRTGVFVACWRIYEQHWTADKAVEEAKRFGLSLPEQEKFIRNFMRGTIHAL